MDCLPIKTIYAYQSQTPFTFYIAQIIIWKAKTVFGAGNINPYVGNKYTISTDIDKK